MKIFRTFFLPLAAAGLSLTLMACSGKGGTAEMIDIDGYERAMEMFPGSIKGIDAGVDRFQATFEDLTTPDIGQRFRDTYADSFFFNDTLHTIEEPDKLVEYMKKTGSALSESTVDVHQIIREGSDVFVRWTMDFKTRAAGRNIHSRSIGITHLRFDDTGRVVLHQDFWDSGHALYAHLPFVGFAVRRARGAM